MNAIIDKVTSGRFLLTVICGITFAYLACSKMLPSEAVMGVLVLVFQAYFNRQDREIPNGKGMDNSKGSGNGV